MPTYQYRCTACDHAFEQVQSFSDDALTVCPECSGKLRKVFNSVGVVFKGSGFYKTDSRSTDGSSNGSSTSGSGKEGKDGKEKTGSSSSSDSSSTGSSGSSSSSTSSSTSSKPAATPA